MALCSKCGTDMKEGARFCPRCGSPRDPVSDSDPDLHVFRTPENFEDVSAHLSRKVPGGAQP